MTDFGGEHQIPADQVGPTSMLRVDGRDVAEYVWQPDLPLSSSPRPYLHPVRTLAGRTVTEAVPDSHPHQLGISIAAPDVGGCNFWGGRTWVAGHGPAWLDNHGTQRHDQWLSHTSSELDHLLNWSCADGTTLIRERRTITCRGVGGTAWSLGIRTELTNATDQPLALRSPAAQGRSGAGYGGFFWRGPTVPTQICSPVGADVRAVHGANADWIAVTGDAPDGSWTLLFVPADKATAHDRWFVRLRDYVGVGSSVTWDLPLVLAPEETISRHIITVVVDGAVPPATLAELADSARSTI